MALDYSPKNNEIERKWLVKELPDLSNYDKSEIIQGYITISKEGAEVRLRKKADKFFLTVKGEGGLVRSEAEVEITALQFNKLWPTTVGKRLTKIRFEIPYKGFRIELDVYGEVFNGLIVAEVEFQSKVQANNFIVPDWFGREITEDKRYKNKILAFQGLPKEL